MAVLLAAACGGGSDLIRERGRSLEIGVTRPQIVERVHYSDSQGQHRVLRPKASNRQLVPVRVTITNRSSTVVPLRVDPEALQLGDRRGDRIDALDPFEAAGVVDSAGPDEGKFFPFLWGPVQLDRGFEVSGWVVFDVPKGLVLGALWWNEVDEFVVDFINRRS